MHVLASHVLSDNVHRDDANVSGHFSYVVLQFRP